MTVVSVVILTCENWQSVSLSADSDAACSRSQFLSVSQRLVRELLADLMS